MTDTSNRMPAMAYSLGGWPAIIIYAVFLMELCINIALLIKGAYWGAILLGALELIQALEILKNSAWSPLYLGPRLSFGPDGIYGRGHLAGKPWHITWSEFESADWGRYGIFVHTKNMKPWESPKSQSGPFNCSKVNVAKAINKAGKFYTAPSSST